jgi:hypothetical protein
MLLLSRQVEIFAMYKALRRQGLKPLSSSSSNSSSSSSADGTGGNAAAAAPAAHTCVPV